MSVFVKEIVDEQWGNYFDLTGPGYGALIAFMLVILVLGCMAGDDAKKKIRTKQLVFSAAAMALAMVTSMIKIVDMPMGGAVTLCSMFFICLVGYMYGLRTGLTSAIAYGVLQLVVDPYIIGIWQLFTDYIFAFGALGLSGIFANKKRGLLWGYLLGALGRFFFTFLSGMIFFGDNAAAYNLSAPVYSFVYNGSYIGLEAVITVIIIMLPAVEKGLAKVKEMARE
ncbi:MAG: proton-coupled thiamine transporter YuaJ [Lachnospiraceae bacterium]|jgi:thiamine transporter|nr:proton-coupled thiamine transporter YuaJ [Lachnospiraceae bacterium]